MPQHLCGGREVARALARRLAGTAIAPFIYKPSSGRTKLPHSIESAPEPTGIAVAQAAAKKKIKKKKEGDLSDLLAAGLNVGKKKK